MRRVALLLVPFLLVAGGLLIAAMRPLTVRTFALSSPNQAQVAALAPSRQTCEGPVTSDGAVGSVGIWGGGVGGVTNVAIQVKDATSRQPLGAGSLVAGPFPVALSAPLDRPVPDSRPLIVCVVNQGPHVFSLLGSAAIHPDIVMTGGQPASEFSLILLSGGDRSLVGSLGTAFSRAALFRPSWVGAWTFWALSIALLLTVALAVVALVRARSCDEAAERETAERHAGGRQAA